LEEQLVRFLIFRAGLGHLFDDGFQRFVQSFKDEGFFMDCRRFRHGWPPGESV